jgi:hypothetical protein
MPPLAPYHRTRAAISTALAGYYGWMAYHHPDPIAIRVAVALLAALLLSLAATALIDHKRTGAATGASDPKPPQAIQPPRQDRSPAAPRPPAAQAQATGR